MFICLPKKEIFTTDTQKKIYPWYIYHHTHGIWPPINGILTSYPWYIDPLSMVFWPPSQWYIEPPIHGILTPLPISWLEMRGSKYHGGSIFHTGGSIFNKGRGNIPWIKIPWHWSFLHSSPITGFVTRLTRVPLVEQEQPTFPEHPSSPRFLVGFVLLDL